MYFYEEVSKIIPKLSPNVHLIWPTDDKTLYIPISCFIYLPLELLPLDCLLPLDSFFSEDLGGDVLVDSFRESFVDSF